MFTFLKKAVVNTEEKYSDEKESDEEDNSYDIYEFLGTLLYNNDSVSYFISDARTIVNNIPVYYANRQLCPSHVNVLEDSLKNDKHIIGSMKIMIDAKKEGRIFDGQHRVKALNQIFSKDASFNMDVLVEVYKVTNFDEEKALDLFARANTVKNVSSTDLPNSKAHKITVYFATKYPDVFKEVVEGRTKLNRPCINKREFYLCLKEQLTNISKDQKYNEEAYKADVIIEAIERMNRDAGQKKMSEFKKKVTQPMYDKAKKYGFYLGLESLEKWIKALFV